MTIDRSGPEPFAPFASRLALEWIASTPDERLKVIPGSLGFFDISGYTRLSERLARSGKIGAEAVSDIVDGVFERLVDDVFRYEGDVIQFSGDAILVFFAGADSEGRAAAGAIAVQRAIDEVGHIDTDSGPVRLRMSAGLHSGEFAFALVGSEQRSLVAFGPDASQTCEMEKAAEPREVRVTASFAARLDERRLTTGRAGGRALRRSGWKTVDTPIPVRPEPDGARSRLLVPVPLREVLAEGRIPAEHRPLALGFIGVRGLDALIEEQGAAEVVRRLDLIACAIEDAQSDYGVTLISANPAVDGCDFFICAGAPVVHEDDEDRVLLALRLILDRDYGLAVSAGANRGRSFSTTCGHPRRRAYSANGDSTNLAARVMAKAEVGQLLATASLLSHTTRRVDTEPITPFAAKGKAALVEAGIVHAVHDSAFAADAQTMTFVGRAAELRILRDGLESARAGAGRVVEIVAEPGVGKSRLLHEFRDTAPEIEFFTTAGDSYAQNRPYFPWNGLLRELAAIPPAANPQQAGQRLEEWVGTCAPDLLPWLPLLAVPVDASVASTNEVERLDARYRQDRLNTAVADLLARALDSPTVLLVEDTHWFDDASLALLRAVADRAEAHPWLVCSTHRPTGTPLAVEAAAVIELGPLGADETTALLLATSTTTPVSDEMVERLVARSAGNPLFALELLRSFDGGSDLPESVERVVGTRIDALAAPDRTLLREAAVLGRQFEVSLLAEVLDDRRVAERTRWTGLASFLEEDGAVLRFRHDLFRLVAYEGLPFTRRRDLHGRAGRLLEQLAGADATTELAPVLALHFHQAQMYDATWNWARRGAEQAVAKTALVDAIDLYRKALDAGRHLARLDPLELSCAAEAMGDLADRIGDIEAGNEGFGLASKYVSRDRVAKGRILRKRGYLAEKSGDYVASLRWYRRAMNELGDAPEGRSESAHSKLGYAATRIHQGNMRDAERWISEVLPDATERDDIDALAQAYLLREIVASESADARRSEYEVLALDYAYRLGDRRRLGSLQLNLGLSAANEGRWDDAAAHYEESGRCFAAVGHVVGSALVAINRASVLTDQGRYDEARVLGEQALRTLRSAHYESGVAIANFGLSQLEVRVRNFARAHELIDRAEAQFRELGAGWYIVATLVRQVEILVCERRPSEALAIADRASEELARVGHLATLPSGVARLRACANAQLGRTADAHAEIERGVAFARADGAEYEVALCLDVAIKLGEGDTKAARERDGILTRLGVVALPEFPCS